MSDCKSPPNYLHRLNLKSKILLSLAFPLIIILPLTVIIYISTIALIESSHWVEHTHKVISHARLLEKNMLDLETGLRGYLITAEERFLEPYNSAQSFWEKSAAQLQDRVSDNPRQVALAKEIDALKQEWVATIAEPRIALRQSVAASTASMAEVIEITKNEAGKQRVDHIRSQIAAFIEHEEALIIKRSLTAETTANKAINQIIFAAILLTIVAIAAAYFLIKSILHPIAELRDATNRVSQGELSQHLVINGTDEIADLASHFNTMIDNIKYANESLENKATELELSSQYKSEFLANMSHEIRTPMNGIIGMAQLLLRTELTDDQTEKLNRLLRSGESLLVILSEILDYSKIEANKITLESIDINIPEILGDVTSFFSAIAVDHGIDFICNFDDIDNKILIGDPTRLRQVINNLCSNAVKFTKQGSVSVIASSKQNKEHSKLVIDVIDTGIGIDAQALETIFQAFSQAEGSTNREYGGTGLGLTISQNLIELMDGELSVESEVNVGTTFRIELNLPISATVADEIKKEEIDFEGIENLKVLVVDDNETNVVLLSWMLEEWGHDILQATNGKECLDVLAHNDVDIIFMDYHMPVMNGKEATEAIRALESNKKDTIIIGCTADVFNESTSALLDCGQNNVISKPVLEDDLHKVLAQHFSKKNYSKSA